MHAAARVRPQAHPVRLLGFGISGFGIFRPVRAGGYAKGRGAEMNLCPALSVSTREVVFRQERLGGFFFVEVAHLGKVFGAGCGVQGCFVCALRQLGELAVAALVVEHADENCREEEDE